MNGAARVRYEHWIERCAIAVCPPGERRWLAAMFAESAAIDGERARSAWLTGAAAIVSAAIGARLAVVLSVRICVAAAVAALLAWSLMALAYVEFEALGADDDVFLVASGVAATALGGIAISIARAVFSREVLASG